MTRWQRAARRLQRQPWRPRQKPDLDAEQIEQVIGRKGNAVGVLQFGIPRGDAIKDAGMDVPPAMGPPLPPTSSQPAAARRRSPATSCSKRAKWNRCWEPCAALASR